MDPLKCIVFSHLSIPVDDLDDSSEFYREVMGFVEMQSHHNLENRGVAATYGITENADRFRVSLRFLSLPGVFTIKLVKFETASHGETRGYREQAYGVLGLGPVSLVLEDLEQTYHHFENYARNPSAKWKIKLLSKPVLLSPILPHQIGATPHSALFQQREILDDIERKFARRVEFQMIDPYGVRWGFNNKVDFTVPVS